MNKGFADLGVTASRGCIFNPLDVVSFDSGQIQVKWVR